MSSNEPENKSEKIGENMEMILEPQPQGGALWRGGPRKHVPGPGRPRNEIRAKLAELVAGKGIDVLNLAMEIATTESDARSMRTGIEAVQVAGRLGLGEAPTIQEGLSDFIASLSVEYVPEDQREAFVKAVFDGMAQFVG